MPRKIAFIFAVFLIPAGISAQSSVQPSHPPAESQGNYTVSNIADDVSKIARSVEDLVRVWRRFAQTFTSNQGLKLNERQQKLILALEILNRTEQSLANMIKLRIDLVEKQSRFRLQLAGITDDLLPQSIDRYVGTRGTTNAEAIRDIRRQSLTKELREMNLILDQIQRELEGVSEDIKRAEAQVRSLRARIFGEIEKELADF